jgi:hypothetical protein
MARADAASARRQVVKWMNTVRHWFSMRGWGFRPFSGLTNVHELFRLASSHVPSERIGKDKEARHNIEAILG